jgi:hypothetical protein
MPRGYRCDGPCGLFYALPEKPRGEFGYWPLITDTKSGEVRNGQQVTATLCPECADARAAELGLIELADRDRFTDDFNAPEMS